MHDVQERITLRCEQTRYNFIDWRFHLFVCVSVLVVVLVFFDPSYHLQTFVSDEAPISDDPAYQDVQLASTNSESIADPADDKSVSSLLADIFADVPASLARALKSNPDMTVQDIAGSPDLPFEDDSVTEPSAGRAVPGETYSRCVIPGVIAVCIDDGYVGYGDLTLDALKAARIPATFFEVGRELKKNPVRLAFAQRIVAEGHSIQHHTWSHEIMSRVPVATIRSELDRALDEYKSLLSEPIRYFRPPQGRYNDAVLQELKARGLSNIMWSYSLKDYGKATPKTVWARWEAVMKEFKPTEAGIIGVQHFSRGADTHTLIPRMAVDARKRGWRFVTLDECLGVTKTTA